MIFLLNIYKFFLNFVYFFIKLLKTRNQITLISRQSNTASLDFNLLSKELIHELKDYKIVVLCKKIDSGLINKIKYVFYIFKLMVNISRSKVVILDSYCIPISLLKHKKSLTVIQIWHAIGLLKKAGYSILNKEEGSSFKISKTLCMHKNYDYILASSKSCIDSFTEVFSCDKNIVIPIPLPRVDLLLDRNFMKEKKAELFSKYDELKNKKNILYAPTFRKDEEEMQIYLDKLISSVDFEKYNLIVKLHPLSKLIISNKKVYTLKEYSTFDTIFISDYVISDYSSIIYEAGILNKPLYFYAFDLNNYDIKRGFFIDYINEVPGVVTDNPKMIIDLIDKNIYDFKKLSAFVNKYVDLTCKNNTKKIIELIKHNLK